VKIHLGIALALHAALLATGWARSKPLAASPVRPAMADEIGIEAARVAGASDEAAPPAGRHASPARAGGGSAHPAARARPGAPPARRRAETSLPEAPDARLRAPTASTGDPSGDASEGGDAHAAAAGGGDAPALPGGSGDGAGSSGAGDSGADLPRRGRGMGERWDSVAGPRSDALPARAPEADERTLPRRAVEAVVGRSAARLRLCYDDGERREPGLAGRILVRYLADPGGSVLLAADGGSTVADPAVVRCVLATFAAMAFPRREGGEPVWATYVVAFPPG
jgi:hypothetical protein